MGRRSRFGSGLLSRFSGTEGGWEVHLDEGSAAAAWPDLNSAAQFSRALTHGDCPDPTVKGRHNATAIIANLEHQPTLIERNTDGARGCLRVADRIGDGLRDDPESSHFDGGG